MIQSIPNLTNGAIYDIMISKKKLQSVILQVIQIKEMRSPIKKYKIALSDGDYYTSSILSSQLNAKIESGDLQTNSIVVLNDFHLMATLDKDILIIKNIDTICLFSSLIGNPSNIVSISSQTSQVIENNNSSNNSQGNNRSYLFSQGQNDNIELHSLQNSQNNNNNQTFNNNDNLPNKTQNELPVRPHNSSQQSQLTPNYNQETNENQEMNSKAYQNENRNSELQQQRLQTFFNATQNTARRHAYIGIDILNQYIPYWTILARVVMKGTIFNYVGKDGKPGKVLNITLKDKTGSEIRGTFYNDQVTVFEPIIEQDKVYEITGGMIKEKNPRFNTTPHDYEISFNSTTKFTPMPDDHTIGKLEYRFKKLADLPNISPRSSVDIIGYVVSVGEIQQLLLKDNRTANKRDIVLYDDSNVKCDMTIWDKEATDFPNEGGFIVAFKDAKISEFKGRSLSSSSTLIINPNFPAAHVLQSWINQCISDPNFDFNKIATVSNGGEATRSFIYLSEINEFDLGTHEKPDYGSAFVTLSDIMLNRRLYYVACPNPECKFKGLIITDNQSFFCDRCQRIIENPAYRYMFTIKVQDFTGSTMMSFVGDDQVGALITGKTAEEWHNETCDLEETDIRQIIQEKFFTMLKVKCRIKSDNYNNRSYVKTNIITAQNLDFADGARFFANEINKYS